MMLPNGSAEIEPLASAQKVLHHIASGSVILAAFALPTSRALLNVCLFVFLICFAFSGRYKQKWLAVRASPIALPLMLLFALVVIGTQYGSGLAAEQVNYVFYYSKLLLGIALIAQFSDDGPLQKKVLMSFALAMLLSACISIIKWLGWLPHDVAILLGASVSDNAAFKDHLIQNVMMSMLCMIALAMLFERDTPLNRLSLAWSSCLLLACFALFVAVWRGRTGQAGFFLGLLLMIPFVISRRKSIVGLLGITLFTASIYILNPTWKNNVDLAITESMNYKEQKESSVGNRLYLHHWTYEQSVDRNVWTNLVGTGTASYPVIARQSLSEKSCEISCPHPHSQFLFFWIEHGLLGLSIFIFLLIRFFGLVQQSASRSHKILLLGFLGTFLADSVFHSSLWLRMEGFFSILMLTLLASMAVSSRGKPASHTEYSLAPTPPI